MKAALILLAACLVVIAVPPAAEAHTAICHVDDVECIARCVADHATTAPPHRCLLIVP